MSSLERSLAEADKEGDIGVVREAALLVKPERVHKVVKRHNWFQVVPADKKPSR